MVKSKVYKTQTRRKDNQKRQTCAHTKPWKGQLIVIPIGNLTSNREASQLNEAISVNGVNDVG